MRQPASRYGGDGRAATGSGLTNAAFYLPFILCLRLADRLPIDEAEGRAGTMDRGRSTRFQPCPSQRMPWTRTGRPTACDSSAASIRMSPFTHSPTVGFFYHPDGRPPSEQGRRQHLINAISPSGRAAAESRFTALAHDGVPDSFTLRISRWSAAKVS
jgi:hypothetical protein